MVVLLWIILFWWNRNRWNMTAIVEIYNRNIVFHPRTPFIHRPRTCNRAQIRTVLPPAVSKQCIVNDYSQSVQVQIELGHKATLRKKINQDGHTHDWTCFVRGPPGCNIQHFVDRVVFYLHDSFLKPKRVVKEPPYQVSESGYGSFSLPIEIYFKTKEEPRKIKFDYDLFLHLEDSPPVNHMRCEKLTFNNPQEDFRRKLLKAGGVGVLSSEEGARMPAPGTPQEPPKAVPDLFGASILENDSKKERSKKHHHKSHKEKHEKHKDQKSKVKDTNSSSSTPQHPATPNPPSTTPTPTHKSSDSHSHSHDKSTKDRHSSKRSSEEGIPSEIPAKKKKKDKDRDKERERSKSTSSSKDKQDKHKHEKDKSVKPEIGSTENVNTSSSVSVKESEKDKKDKEKHREKHRDGSSSSHNKHKHKSHKDKRHEHKSDKKSGEHKSDKKSDEHKKVENKSDSHRSGSPSKHKSRESTKSPPKSQPEKHDMSLSSKKIDKSSTETSKTKESSPKAKESSPKAKESSLKAKECSPNAKESSPKAKEHTPKAKEPTPKSKEHSPKSKESHKKESSAAVNKDSPQKVADSSKSKEMKKLPPLEDLFDASESDPFEDDDSDKEDAPDSKTDAGLTSSQQKMVDDRSKQFLKSLFDDDDDDSEDDDEGGEKPEETVTAGDDTKVVDMDIDDDDDGDDEDDDEGPPTKPSSPNNIFSKFDHPVSHPVVSPTHQMSPQHLVEAVSNGLSSVDTLVDNTDKSYSYLNESKKHRSRLSPSAAVPSGGSTHRSRPYHPTLQADHPMQRLDQLEPRIADHPVEHVDQPTQRADYPSQQLPHSPSKSRTTPQAHRHGKDPEPAHWSSSKTNSRPRDLEQQPWATNQTSTPVPKSHDPTTWATSHSEILAKNKKLSPPKLGMEPPDLLKSHGDFLQHQVPQHSPDSGKGHQVREHKSPTPASRMLLENGSSLPEPTQHPGCAPNGEPFTLLLSIQEKLSSTREEAVLGEVIRILDSNDEVFSITNTSLDFDLCYVNSVTIQQLKHCLQLS